MVVGIASRIANDDDMIARLQRLARDALTAECSAAAPFDGIANGLALFILAFNVDERMRIAEQELNEVALDRLLLVFEIRCRERMMRVKRNARQQRCCSN